MKAINAGIVAEYLKAQISKLIKSDKMDNIALGCLRYEALRKLNVQQFSELYKRNISEGIPLDMLVDELIWENSV